MIPWLDGGGADGIIILSTGGSRGQWHDVLRIACSRDNFMISALGLGGEGGGNTKICGWKRRWAWWVWISSRNFGVAG